MIQWGPVIASPHHTIEVLRTRFIMEPMPMMRGQILAALDERADDGLVPFLLTLLEGATPAMAADCLEGLCGYDDATIIDEVQPYLYDPHPNLRRLALLVLWQFPFERRGLLPTVYDLFPSMKEQDYFHLPIPARASYLVGIRTVGDLRLDAAVPQLRQGLTWDDAQVRLECACSLRQLGEEDGADDVCVRIKWGDEEARRRVEALPVDNRAFFG